MLYDLLTSYEHIDASPAVAQHSAMFEHRTAVTNRLEQAESRGKSVTVGSAVGKKSEMSSGIPSLLSP